MSYRTEAMPVYQQALGHYGKAAQLLKTIEELAELSREVSRLLNYESTPQALKDVAQEIADVRIMTDQIAYICGIEEEVEHQQILKIRRLQQRMEVKAK